MSKIIASLISVLLVSSAYASCPTTIAENCVTIAKVAVEAQGGDFSSLPQLISGLDSICDNCGLKCTFLDQLHDGVKTGTDAMGCINGIADSFEGAAQAIGSGGIDIFGDVQTVYGIY